MDKQANERKAMEGVSKAEGDAGLVGVGLGWKCGGMIVGGTGHFFCLLKLYMLA